MVLAVLAAACAPSTAPSTTTTTGAPTTSEPSSTVATPTTQARLTPGTTAPEQCFPEGMPFEQEGFMGRSDLPGDSTAISGVSWTDSGDCAALTIEFRTAQGAPAVDPPTYRGEFLRELGVVRIAFGPDLVDSTLSNQVMSTDLLDAMFVVWDQETGALVADVLLEAASLTRIRTVSAPARLVLEVIRGGPELPERPDSGPTTILLSPGPGSLTTPIAIQGYGRAGSTIDIAVRSTAPTRSRELQLAPSPTAWTLFRSVVDTTTVGIHEVSVGDAPRIALNLP